MNDFAVLMLSMTGVSVVMILCSLLTLNSASTAFTPSSDFALQAPPGGSFLSTIQP